MEKISHLLFKKPYYIYIAITIVIFILYGKTLFYGFSPMDEQWLLVKKNLYLASSQALKDAFTKPTLGIYYRPFFLLSFIIDFYFGKLNPLFYHLSNIIYHIIFCCLFFKLLKHFLVSNELAVGLILFFIIHPVLLHAVAWIPGRNDLILGVFILSSVLTLLKYLQTHKILFLLCHLLFVLCALLTKENAIVLPFIYFFIYTINAKKDKMQLLKLLFFWTTLSVLWFYTRKNIINYFPPINNDILLTFKNVFLSNFIFMGKILLPYNLSVYPIYEQASVITGVIVFIIFLISWFYVGVKSKSIALFGLFFYFMLLLIPIWFGATKSNGEHFEHRMYTSLIGIFIFISQLKINWKNTISKYVVCSIAVLFCFKLYSRMPVYESKVSFTDAGLIDAPKFYLFHVDKGEGELILKKYSNALYHFQNANKLRPNKSEILNGLGNSYSGLKNEPEAIKNYTQALEIFGYNEVVLFNRCKSYYFNNELKNACNDLDTLIQHHATCVTQNMEKTIKKEWFHLQLNRLNQLIITEPKVSLNYYNRAVLYFNYNKQYDLAQKDLETALYYDQKNEDYILALKQIRK